MYDVGPLILNRLLGINTRVEKLYRREDVMYVDVWDNFNKDRSLFIGDSLHLNRVGKARLGRVLDEDAITKKGGSACWEVVEAKKTRSVQQIFRQVAR